MSLLQGIQIVRPADLPLKIKHKLVIDQKRKGNLGPIEKEILFQQFVEWVKNRADHDQDVPLLRPSIAR
jgi:hypothetical protein